MHTTFSSLWLIFCLTLLSGCAPQQVATLPIRGAVDGVVVAAAGENGANDHADSPYYRTPNPDVPRPHRVALRDFRTYQQTSEVSCGAAAAVMALAHLGIEDVTEEALAREMDTRPPNNPRADGSYGAATSALAQAMRNHGVQVTSSADTQNAAGYSFADPEAFAGFVSRALQNNTVVLAENMDWGGHWKVIIGYDTMGTPTLMDDVLIFADPYDTTDHVQDGLTTHSFMRFFSEWFDAGVLPAGQRIQQYVALSR